MSLSDFQFGNFSSICSQSNLPACLLFETQNGVQNSTFDRECNVVDFIVNDAKFNNLGDLIAVCGSIIVQGFFAYALFSKKAAVGRVEMFILYVTYIFVLLLQLFTTAGLVALPNLQYIAAVQVALIVSYFWILMMNGLVSFQIVEDGSIISLSILGGTTIIFFVATLVVGLDIPFDITSGAVGQNGLYSSYGLFGLYLLFPLLLAFFYLFLETFLVLRYLGQRKSLLYLYSAAIFLALGLAFLFALNQMICKAANSQNDGTMIATISFMIASGLLFKFWDDITEDEWDNGSQVFG